MAFSRLAATAILLLILGGCAIRLVSGYDQGSFDSILSTEREVDLFYGELLESPQSDRPYSKYASRYVRIETDLRVLVTRNQARPFNSESTQICTTMLDLWNKYRERHRQANAYPDGIAKLDRARFTRLFRSALKAEGAKKDEE